jgi:predicted nuclease of predicted toxin-antitoxin system
VGTLSSELGAFADQLAETPRVYADANLPAGLVRFMRERLKWDVLFVMEDEDLRRAADILHFRLAGQLRRTLVTLDRDYLDDARFPPGECGGVVVLSAPNETQFQRLLQELDRALFQDGAPVPLQGRKLHVHTDWSGELEEQ